MSISEIISVLEKGEELTSKEIANKLRCSLEAVKQSLRRLKRDSSENLEFRKLTSEEKEGRFGHKIGCRIFIYKLNN